MIDSERSLLRRVSTPEVDRQAGGNYSCSARNAHGVDSATFVLRVLGPPAPPAPRLARADTHSLHLAWDPPPDGGAPVIGT